MAVRVIEVLGPGCSRRYEPTASCATLSRRPSSTASCRSESADRMIELGVLKTPAVAFDGRVVLSGHIPKSDEVKRLLGLA